MLPGPLDLRGLWAFVGLNRDDLTDPAFVPKTNRNLAENKESASAAERAGGDARAGRAAAPPVRLVLDQRAAVPGAGRGRPEGAGDQADAVPHLRRLPDHRRPDRRRRGRQAGAGAGGDQGPVRREANIKWARKLERAGRARGLRPGRPEDALQVVAWSCATTATGCAATATSAPATTTPRPRGCTRTSGCSPPTTRSARTWPTCSTSCPGYSMNTEYDRLLVAPHSIRSGLVERIEREVANHEAGLPARDPLQVQLDRGREGHRRAVPGVAGRGAGRRPGPRHLRDPPEVPGMSDNIRVRSILGRFLEHSPGLRVRQRRRPRGLDRVGRPHAPQPRPPGRDPGAPGQPRARRRGGDVVRHGFRPRDIGLGSAPRRHLDPAHHRCGRCAVPGPPGAPDRGPVGTSPAQDGLRRVHLRVS